jgi:hypothetical protein
VTTDRSRAAPTVIEFTKDYFKTTEIVAKEF